MEDAGFFISYDALVGQGYTVIVKDARQEVLEVVNSSGSGSQDCDASDRAVLMKLARRAAREMANTLKGRVLVGYDPSILSRELFGELELLCLFTR